MQVPVSRIFLNPELGAVDPRLGIASAELEPFYDRFEYLTGTSGKAGHLNGKKIPGRQSVRGVALARVPDAAAKGAVRLGEFKGCARVRLPLVPAALVRPACASTTPEGLRMNACMVCGFCERFGCEHFAKSLPQTALLPVLPKDRNFILRTPCQVHRVNLASSKTRAAGVTCVDGAGRQSSSRPISRSSACSR